MQFLKRAFLCLAAAAMLLLPAPLQGIPAAAEDPAAPTESVAAMISGTANLIFIIDSTGSMRHYIDSVQENLVNFVNSLSARGVTLNMSVIEYRDIFEDGPDSTIVYKFGGSKWTSDVNEVIRVFRGIDVDGGGDDPETPLDAFEKIETIPDDGNTFIFLLTDDQFKDYDVTEANQAAGHYCMDAWVQKWRTMNVKVTVVSRMKFEPVYETLYSLTGGRFIDIESDDYFRLMQEYSEWLFENTIDSDGDGLLDEWETDGVDTDHDGVIDLDLPAMGADPNVPDVFIEVDWMEQVIHHGQFLWRAEYDEIKSSGPSAKALEMAYNEFKAHGIRLHIDAGPDSVMDFETGKTWGSLSGGNALPFQKVFNTGDYYKNWNAVAMDNFTRARWTTFNYCMFVSKYDAGNGKNSSGIAQGIPSQFFIVAKNSIDNGDRGEANTFMHELGHVLGLSHGGLYVDTNGELVNNHDNHKPNHLSIMNYNYQFKGMKQTDGSYVSSYQNFDLPEINERDINENRGIDPNGVAGGYRVMIHKNSLFNPQKFEYWKGGKDNKNGDVARQPIDFNGDKKIEEHVSYNLNADFDKQDNDILGVMTKTCNEWTHLRFKGGLIGGYGEEIDLEAIETLVPPPDPETEIEELSPEEAFEMGLLGDPGECTIRDSKPVLFSGISGQTLPVVVENLYPEDTTVELNVELSVSQPYHETIQIGQEALTVEVPVPGVLVNGTYDVHYSLQLADGGTVDLNGSVEVIDPELYEMRGGESVEIPAKGIITCLSTDPSVVEVSGGRITALKPGTAGLTIRTEEGTFCAKVQVTGSGTAAPAVYRSSGGNSAVVMSVLIFVAFFGSMILMMVLLLRKKNPEDSEMQGMPPAAVPQDGGLYVYKAAPGAFKYVTVQTGPMMNTRFKLADGETVVIGKDAARANLVLSSAYDKVSRVHCSVTYQAAADNLAVTDHGSLNGTFLHDGTRLTPDVMVFVRPGEVLTLGDKHCKVKLG